MWVIIGINAKDLNKGAVVHQDRYFTSFALAEEELVVVRYYASEGYTFSIFKAI